jgi:hypothetical protein
VPDLHTVSVLELLDAVDKSLDQIDVAKQDREQTRRWITSAREAIDDPDTTENQTRTLTPLALWPKRRPVYWDSRQLNLDPTAMGFPTRTPPAEMCSGWHEMCDEGGV